MVRRWAPLLAPLLVLLAYVRALDAPFFWDDRHLILESPQTAALQPLATYFGSAFWRSPGTGDQRGYYRPLAILSLTLDHVVHGENPVGFHLTNVALHVLCVCLLYALLRRHGVGREAAALLALLWGLLPRLTEAAVWIAGRTDVLATACVLGALLTHRPGRAGRMIAASVLLLLGLFAKEVALAGALALVVLELSTAGMSRAGRCARAAIPAATVALYLALRNLALQGVTTAIEAPMSSARRAILVVATVGEYVRMLALPWFAELQIGVAAAPRAWSIALGGATLAGVGALAFRAPRLLRALPEGSRALVLAGVSLAGAGFGLVLHAVPLAVNVVAADRFLYLPAAGLVLAIAPGVGSARLPARAGLGLAVVLAASFFVATWVRVGAWGSELGLWIATYHETPRENSVPLNELGGIYYRAGLFERAASIYAEEAKTAHDPRAARANHANALGELGDYDASARELTDLCAGSPNLANYCLSAGLIELRRLRFEPAGRLILLALDRARGDYPPATSALAILPQAAAAMTRPAYDSGDAVVRAPARFEVDALVGRRQEALRLAEEILDAKEEPVVARREAARYWALLGPPRDLSRVLEDPRAGDAVAAGILDTARARVRAAATLEEAWPRIGVPE